MADGDGAGAAIARDSGADHREEHLAQRSCVLRLGAPSGLIERNPAVGVEHPPDRKRERVLTATEIRALWQATAGPGDFNAIVRLLLLTGCRASEIGSLRWSEIFSIASCSRRSG